MYTSIILPFFIVLRPLTIEFLNDLQVHDMSKTLTNKEASYEILANFLPLMNKIKLNFKKLASITQASGYSVPALMNILLSNEKAEKLYGESGSASHAIKVLAKETATILDKSCCNTNPLPPNSVLPREISIQH